MVFRTFRVLTRGTTYNITAWGSKGLRSEAAQVSVFREKREQETSRELAIFETFQGIVLLLRCAESNRLFASVLSLSAPPCLALGVGKLRFGIELPSPVVNPPAVGNKRHACRRQPALPRLDAALSERENSQLNVFCSTIYRR